LFFLQGCSHHIKLKPDNQWHIVWSVNRAEISNQLDIKKDNNCDINASEQSTEIRIIRLTNFIDLSNFPETKDKSMAFYSKTEHAGVPIKLLDSGPLDISQKGSTYQIQLTKGMALISRTIETCSELKITKLKKED